VKFRDGFVSNSSSTSFTVVVKPDAVGKNIEVFDAVTRVLGRVYTRITITDYIKDIDEKQMILTRDRNYIEDKLTALKEIAKDEKLTTAINATIAGLKLDSKNIDVIRYTRREKNVRDAISDAQQSYKIALGNIAVKNDCLTQKRMKVAHLDRSLMLITWEDSNMGYSCNAVEQMESDDVLIVIERKHT
jgi:hypothetical protein